MKSLKKISAVVLALVLMFTFAACTLTPSVEETTVNNETTEAAENTELVNSYGAKLANQGYEEGSVTDSYGNVYKTYYTTFANGKREYGLTLTLFTYWNPVQELGQFQVQISIGEAKK